MRWIRQKSLSLQGGAPDSQPSAQPYVRLSFVDQVQELARDLVTLEVNTIIKSNMTAERMPSVPNALLDIARNYLRAFVVLRADVREFLAREPSDGRDWRDLPVRVAPLDAETLRFLELPDPIQFGRLFECLRWAAKNTRHAIVSGNLPIAEEHVLLLSRIEHNSDTLRTLLDRYPGLRGTEVSSSDIRAERAEFIPHPELTTRDFLIVRKIWEIGVDHIVAQTSIQLDGDVVTRIDKHLAADRERTDQVLSVHQQGIQTGISNWRAIIDAAVAVVGGITGRSGRGR